MGPAFDFIFSFRCVTHLYVLFPMQLFGLTLHLPLQRERERHFITSLSFITSTSTVYLFPSVSNLRLKIRLVEKQGLCAVLPYWGSQRGPLFFTYILVQFCQPSGMFIISCLKKLFCLFFTRNHRRCEHLRRLSRLCQQSCDFCFYAVHHDYSPN